MDLEYWTYDAAGQVQTYTDNDGNDREWFYQNGTLVGHVGKIYDWAGRLQELDQFGQGSPAQLVSGTTYSYDAQGRTTGLVSRNAAGAILSQFDYTYDLRGEVLTDSDGRVYTYDAQGQLTGDGSATYSVSAGGNRTMTGYQTGAGNELLSDGTWNYTYDAAGNETGKTNIATGETWTYSFDNKNDLTAAVQKTISGTVEMEADYKYDAFGNRLETDVWTAATGTVVTKFALDGWNPAKGTPVGNENWDVVADLDGSGSLTTRYLRGDVVDQLLARLDKTGSTLTPYGYLTDNLGSIRTVLDGNGHVVDSITYDAFGNITAETNAGERGRYAWTGRELDVETGLQYNRARYYDSSTGRWISQDPIGFAAGDSNLYRYVTNKPIELTDSSGFEPDPISLSTSAIHGRLLMKGYIQDSQKAGSYNSNEDGMVYTKKLGWLDTGHVKHHVWVVSQLYKAMMAGRTHQTPPELLTHA